MTRPVRVVAPFAPGDPTRPAGAGGDQLDELMRALAVALAGDGPAVLVAHPAATDGGPGTSGDDDRALADALTAGVPTDIAVVVRTSGSTGAPRAVLLSARALRASAAATSHRLGGPGRWLLALPVEHVAGLQVVIRSVMAGTRPVVIARGPFRPAAFAVAARTLANAAPDGPTGVRRYTSLVPTQLGRLLADDDGTAALRLFDAVLLGGAAAAPSLVAAARSAGVHVVTTYGMSETCGGCVYDGVPLDGVRVDVDADGRILLAGAVLASGYLGRPELDRSTFVVSGGRRWLRTTDHGSLARGTGGRDVLRVHGRIDDVIVTGGEKVAPAAVAHAVAALDGVAEVAVVGVPDPEWGQAVTAVVVPTAGTPLPTLATVRAQVTRALGAASAPRYLVVVDTLPVRGPGKIDLRAVAELAAERTGTGGSGASRPAVGAYTPTP